MTSNSPPQVCPHITGALHCTVCERLKLLKDENRRFMNEAQDVLEEEYDDPDALRMFIEDWIENIKKRSLM